MAGEEVQMILSRIWARERAAWGGADRVGSTVWELWHVLLGRNEYVYRLKKSSQ